MSLQMAGILGRNFWLHPLTILGLIVALAGFVTLSYRINNPSVSEIAGHWTVTEMRNINPAFRYDVWENLNFTIEPSGLLGNKNSPFTMLVMRENCGPDCYYVRDLAVNFLIPGPYKLVRDSPDRLFLYPTADSRMTFERLK
jgi:hypothetical protein